MSTSTMRRPEARKVRALAYHQQKLSRAVTSTAALAVKFDRVRRVITALDPEVRAVLVDQVGRFLDNVAAAHEAPKRRGRR